MEIEVNQPKKSLIREQLLFKDKQFSVHNISAISIPELHLKTKRQTENGIHFEASIQSTQSLIICQICESQCFHQDKVRICDCPHTYCQSCINDYILYKLARFQEVFCPHQECNLVMNTQLSFFRNLSTDIQRRYLKIHAFYMASKNPLLRLCPNQKCELGILHLEQNVNPHCILCNQTSCNKCFLQVHQGPCSKQQVRFLEVNLHYRQCCCCKAIIEKVQGCKHITCQCGYEFCYECGQKWIGSKHFCRSFQKQQQFRQQRVRACRIKHFWRIISNLIQILFLVPLLFVCITLVHVFIGAGFFITGMVVGVFAAPCLLLYQYSQRHPNSIHILIIMVIFYPLTALWGLIRSMVTVTELTIQTFEKQTWIYYRYLFSYLRLLVTCSEIIL